MIDRMNPKSRSDQYGRRINRDHSPVLSTALPYLTIMLGSLLAIIPLTGTLPFLPPLGYLTFLGWRVMRPGLLPMWAGLPLGAFDDLFSGQPFGSAILLWSITMIGFELLEMRFPWRSFLHDWFAAAMATTAYILLAITVSGASPNLHHLIAALPQILLSALLYPIIARMIDWLDRIRLTRVKVVD